MIELARTFLDVRGETLAPDAVPALAKVLEETVAAARQLWPSVVIDANVWMRALAPLAPSPLDPAQPFGALFTSDHYLAFACGSGDAPAVAVCDGIIVREAGFAATGTRVHESVRDEAMQIVREALLAPRSGKPAAIMEYAARGALRAWIRVAVSREMLRLAKAQSRTQPLEEHLVASPAVTNDPLLEELKSRYRTELANAFRAALDELPARERTLLRYQVIDGLTIDEIGAIHRVHRATAARWIAKIREDLVEKTRATMAKALGVDSEEAASIVRLVQSQLDVSVIRHLAE